MKKTKYQTYRHDDLEEDQISLRDYKRMKERKRNRNFDNALKSKNLDALLDYTEYDDYDDEEREQYG